MDFCFAVPNHQRLSNNMQWRGVLNVICYCCKPSMCYAGMHEVHGVGHNLRNYCGPVMQNDKKPSKLCRKVAERRM